MQPTDRDTRPLRAADPAVADGPVADGAFSRWTGLLAALAAVLAGAVLIFGGLGGDRLNGDEHNAIVFLTDGLWEYLRSFHYGHVIKLHVWLLHEAFGNSFFWYRMPAALAATAVLVWLALYRAPGLAGRGIGQALVVLLLGANASFLNFARWGMPGYAETLLAGSVLLGLVLADVMSANVMSANVMSANVMRPAVASADGLPRWTWPRLLLIALLPWLYPAAVILLGGITAYLVLDLMLRYARGVRTGALRALAHALVPVVLGLLSFVAYRLSVPDAHWERARAHHKAFSSWQAQGGDGAAGFVWESLRAVGRDLARMTTLSSDSPFAALTPLYAQLVMLVGALCVLALALALWRAWRLRAARPAADVAFLRGAALLWTVLLSGLAVTNAAALVDAFPVGSLRHLFFLLGVPALLAVLSLGYLGQRLGAVARAVAGPWPVRAARVAGLLALVALGVGLAQAGSTQRRVEADKYARLLEILHAPDNNVVYVWSPGFYFAGATLPGQARFLDLGRGGSQDQLRQALKALQDQGGGRLAVFTSEATVGDPALARLVGDFGLRIERQADYGSYEAISFRVPDRAQRAATVSRTVELTVPLPASPIVSVRLDPSQRTQASVTIEQLVFTDASGPHPVDVCGDRGMASMRTTRLGSGPGCTFVFGNGANAGWIGPSALKNLGHLDRPALAAGAPDRRTHR
ncbi:hypothetical protein [Agrilutibacter solisilvae]|uniref:Uncharacterized protein n=1 Tax=Agrilutibacter solisilvae TaxID=2763317 RepID=A0A974Y389_9GAMM|nr:hypothetical protein [Lysobacter solisilvae]QSX79665.1 hypothetical protein I8J32_007425 [Lysobacter solisilvae]